MGLAFPIFCCRHLGSDSSISTDKNDLEERREKGTADKCHNLLREHHDLACGYRDSTYYTTKLKPNPIDTDEAAVIIAKMSDIRKETRTMIDRPQRARMVEDANGEVKIRLIATITNLCESAFRAKAGAPYLQPLLLAHALYEYLHTLYNKKCIHPHLTSER